ncbi:MAG TPA: glycosyltransferase family 2 protein [Lacunisphaera sp.]|nr:glycosyltransferase family 2 protein [Lacunisphaera sp.]
MPPPRCSLVIPFYQEAGNVAPVVSSACKVLQPLDAGYEAIFINDGSTDATGRELAAAVAALPRARVVTLPENRGQAAALALGLQQAQGELIFTMDGDGQNDPADFPALLELLERDRLDLVCGWRRDRRDPPVRRVMSRLGNAIRRRVLFDRVHDAGCQLRVFRRAVVGALQPSPLMQSFLPAMAAAAGFRLGELPVRHHPRRHGASKYRLGNLWWRPFSEMIRLRRALRPGSLRR